MHASFLEHHHEIVEYQYWMRAAAEASIRHVFPDYVKYGYTLNREEFHRFWAKWTFNNIDDEDFKVTCTTVENRDFQWPAFDCQIV